MIGVPVNKTIRVFSARNKNSYNKRASDCGIRDPGPLFFSENLDILFILLTILLIKL